MFEGFHGCVQFHTNSSHAIKDGYAPLMGLTAIDAWFALPLQFPLTVATSRANGIVLGGAITIYFSFFTIITNFLATLILSFSVDAGFLLGEGGFFFRPAVSSGTAVFIAMVAAGYSLLVGHL